MKWIVTLILILACASAEELPHFMSAEKYRHWNKNFRLLYVTGWMDARAFDPDGHAVTHSDKFRECTTGKTNHQMMAILDKYVKAHPEIWDKAAIVAADAALHEMCGVVE
jgi:hypothetical protein